MTLSRKLGPQTVKEWFWWRKISQICRNLVGHTHIHARSIV